MEDAKQFIADAILLLSTRNDAKSVLLLLNKASDALENVARQKRRLITQDFLEEEEEQEEENTAKKNKRGRPRNLVKDQVSAHKSA